MIETIKNSLTLFIIFPLVIFLAGYLSFKFKFLQITKLSQAFRFVTAKETKGGISSFAALAAILGGNLGTGNISGVAVALATGGPGSLFWMWVVAILASITKYIGCFLGVHFQKKNHRNEWVGGPMYYLRDGIGSKILAKLFCLLTIVAALSVGNLVQINALSIPMDDLNFSPLIFALIMALLVGAVIFGGLKRFSHVVSSLVPAMAVLYVSACLIILFIHRDDLGFYLQLIVKSAFDFGPISGGFFGYTILNAIQSGFDRGLFATDSGLGLAPIVHASVKSSDKGPDNRHVQGVVSILSPIIVMLVCTMTGLVLLTTGAWQISGLHSTRLCMEAFRLGFQNIWAGNLITLTLMFFAFTTILTWSFCASRAAEFLWGDQSVNYFRVVFVLVIPFGALINAQTLWQIADISINLMFIVNIFAIYSLRKIALSYLKGQTHSSKNS